MLVRTIFALLAIGLTSTCLTQGLRDRSGDADSLPNVPDVFRIEFVAREPLVRNPCAMAFDFAGRLCVGMGPQYRSPNPTSSRYSRHKTLRISQRGC